MDAHRWFALLIPSIHTYRSIIDTHIIPFMNEKNDSPASFILQEDNWGPHRARSFAMYLQNMEVTCMARPSQSPDLNCIENVCDF